MAYDPKRDFTEKYSLAPVTGVEELTAAGVTEKTFGFAPRAIQIITPWSAAEGIEVKFVGDTSFTAISEAMVKAWTEGAIYPYAIQSFRSTGALETAFTIAALR